MTPKPSTIGGPMNPVAMTFARFTAKNIVKQDWRDQGRKLSEISNRDLTSFANAYLAGNPQLVEQARKQFVLLLDYEH
jgi:hypothetical protein